MNLVSRYLERTEFKDYEDYHANLRYKPVEKFNFAYDVVQSRRRTHNHFRRAFVAFEQAREYASRERT